MGQVLASEVHYQCMQASARRQENYNQKHCVNMKPDVQSGHFPVTPHAQMVDVVNETRVLRQARLLGFNLPTQIGWEPF